MGSGLEIVTYSGSVEKPHILESDGNGVLVLDYDGDGYQDLYFVAAFRIPRQEEAEEERSALYRNQGDGTFVEVSQQAGVGARVYGHGGCVGDYNGDGLPDIYLTAYGDNILYRNNGDGTFRMSPRRLVWPSRPGASVRRFSMRMEMVIRTFT